MNCINCCSTTNVNYLPCGCVLCDYCIDPNIYNNSKHMRRCPMCTKLYIDNNIVPIEPGSLICKECHHFRPVDLKKPCRFCGLSYEYVRNTRPDLFDFREELVESDSE